MKTAKGPLPTPIKQSARKRKRLAVKASRRANRGKYSGQ